MNKTVLFIAGGLAVVLLGWYAFRPERLFINEVVSEDFPQVMQTDGSPEVLSLGNFHSVAHDAMGTATIYKLKDGDRKSVV